MKILHYSLGFPPYRTGGMTKFCIDIMAEQLELGHEVALLWPGRMLFGSEIRIRQNKAVNGIGSWEIINPLPVPYDEGIKDIEAFINNGDSSCFEAFLESMKPDVVHIHTLMGLHSSFLDACKIKRIRIVFSAHDFYPICPKVTMFHKGKVCDEISNCEHCSECNNTALSMWKIRLLQSGLYRAIKNSRIVLKLRKKHRDNFLSGVSEFTHTGKTSNCSTDYLELRQHYARMLEHMDIIHFNSLLTKNIYERYIYNRNSDVIAITHSNINDYRKVKTFSENKLRMTYLGPYGQAKGFFLLKETLDELWKERQDFSLNVFFGMDDKPPYIVTHDRYDYYELDNIFDMTDVLIVPSMWYETFGFTALEALSYGVPVILTANVGAKDILPAGAGIVVESITVEDLKKAISSLSVDKLSDMNKCIISDVNIPTLTNVTNEIIEKCYVR